MPGCCVIPLLYVVSGVCYTLGRCAVEGDGSCDMDMFNMADSCLSTSCGVGLDGAGLWRDFVSSTSVCVTASDGERLGNFFCTGNSSIVSDTCYDAVLGIYNVRHQ